MSQLDSVAGNASLSEVDNGRTVAVARGANVELTLHSVYWQIVRSSDVSVIAPVSIPVYSGAGTLKCIPGSGCGTVKATFKAVARGTATISASRTSCGEALQCVGAEGTFKVTLVVK